MWGPVDADGTVNVQVPEMLPPPVSAHEVNVVVPSHLTVTELPLNGLPPLLTVTEVPIGPDDGLNARESAPATYVGVAPGVGVLATVAVDKGAVGAPSAFATLIRPKAWPRTGSVAPRI